MNPFARIFVTLLMIFVLMSLFGACLRVTPLDTGALPLTPQPSIPEPSPTPDPLVACVPDSFFPTAYFPDEARLLGRTESGAAILNLSTCRVEKTFLVSQTIEQLALSPDGYYMAWALGDHSLQILSISDGRMLQSYSGHTARVTGLAFSAGDALLYSASQDGTVKSWDRLGHLQQVLVSGPEPVLGLGLSPDDRYLTILRQNAPALVWDLYAHQ